MKPLFLSALFGQQHMRCDPSQVRSRGSSKVKADAEAAAFCSMKLAEAETRARDGREFACCG
jgi:hypothetical protein